MPRDFVFLRVVEFVAVRAENFNAVVRRGIVRRGDDDAGVCVEAARDSRDRGGWQDAAEFDVDARSGESGGEGVFEDAAGASGVAADDGGGVWGERGCERLADRERDFGGEWPDICLATDSIGSEEFFHGTGVKKAGNNYRGFWGGLLYFFHALVFL